MEKILILPEVYDEVHTWWPYWVVLNMFRNDYKNNFIFIKKQWTINRSEWPSTNKIKKFIRYFWSVYIIFFIIKILKIILNYIINKEYNLKIISHDLFFSFCFIFFWKSEEHTFIYHWQWPSYYEMINIWWAGKSIFLKRFLFYFEYYVFKNSTFIGFPSKWAYNSYYIKTTSKIKKILDKKRVLFLYNWIKTKQDYIIPKSINNINKDNIMITSVWTLNYEKWIDQIPSLIYFLIKKWLKIKWILIGNWKLEKNINQQIKKLKIEKSILQINKPLTKKEIIWIFKNTDYYLMLHRLSIFDYATLEAMNEWAIPILSNIWWNKEVIKNNNWLLISENEIKKNNYTKVFDFIKKDNNKLKILNKKVINTFFNDKTFIKWYYKIYE